MILGSRIFCYLDFQNNFGILGYSFFLDISGISVIYLRDYQDSRGCVSDYGDLSEFGDFCHFIEMLGIIGLIWDCWGLLIFFSFFGGDYLFMESWDLFQIFRTFGGI